MSRITCALILLISLAINFTCCRLVDKCCESGDVLMLNATSAFECVRKGKRLDLQSNRKIKGEAKGLPRCAKSTYYEQKLWSQGLRVSSDACLDIFVEPKSRQSLPVIIYCKTQTILRRFELQYLAVTPVVEPRAAKVFNFRKCCAKEGNYYDIEGKFCAEGQADLKLLFARLSELDFIAVYSGPPECEHVLVDYKVPLADVYYDNGDVKITIPWKVETMDQVDRKNVTIEPKNVCLDAQASSDFIVARVCQGADYCLGNPCIRKCCPENHEHEPSLCLGDTINNVNVQSFRTSLALIADSSNVTAAFNTQNYGLLIGKPCGSIYVDDQSSWNIGTLGEITQNDYEYTYTHANSCLEFVYNSSYATNGLQPFFCFDEDDTPKPRSYYKLVINACLSLISCFSLLATLIVYICLPSLQNLHGKTIMCHSASLSIAYACLAINTITTKHIIESVNTYFADVACIYIAFAMVFCFHSAFLWLNVMCFDIWWTFGGLQGASSAAAKRAQERKKFFHYNGYAWGLGFLLSSLAIASDSMGLLGSQFARERCWFDEKSASEVVFFIAPISIELVANTIFFIITSKRCSKVKADIKRVMANVRDPTARKFHSDKTRLIMNVKLFVLMGIPWLLDNFTSYLNHYGTMPLWVQEISFVADVVNSLQGLWIFILFVLKPKVYRALKKRFGTRKLRNKSSNNLTVAPCPGNVHKSSSTSTLTSNFMLSSSS